MPVKTTKKNTTSICLLLVITSPIILFFILLLLTRWIYYFGWGEKFKIASKSPDNKLYAELIHDDIPRFIPYINHFRINLSQVNKNRELIYLNDTSDVNFPKKTRIIWSKDSLRFLLVSFDPEYNHRGFTGKGDPMVYLTTEINYTGLTQLAQRAGAERHAVIFKLH